MQNFSKERSRFCKQYSDVADSKRFNGLSGWEWEIFKKLGWKSVKDPFWGTNDFVCGTEKFLSF